GLPEVEMEADDDALNNLGEVQEWLADSKDRLRNAFSNPRARYLQTAPEIDQDLVVFGTAVEFVGENRNRNHLLFQSLHLKDITPFFSEEGEPEGLFHKRSMSVRMLADRFGEKSLSDRTRQLLRDQPDKKLDILHAVIPRNEFKANA